MHVRTAATAILVTILCSSCSRPTPQDTTAVSNEVSQVSQALVGKQITIRGKFSLLGKVGAFVALDNGQLVYLEPTKGSFTWGKPYSEMQDKLVSATGTLRFYRDPPAKSAGWAVQRVPDHFYFEVESAQVRLILQ